MRRPDVGCWAAAGLPCPRSRAGMRVGEAGQWWGGCSSEHLGALALALVAGGQARRGRPAQQQQLAGTGSWAAPAAGSGSGGRGRRLTRRGVHARRRRPGGRALHSWAEAGRWLGALGRAVGCRHSWLLLWSAGCVRVCVWGGEGGAGGFGWSGGLDCLEPGAGLGARVNTCRVGHLAKPDRALRGITVYSPLTIVRRSRSLRYDR
jgi:hypothetical protein